MKDFFRKRWVVTTLITLAIVILLSIIGSFSYGKVTPITNIVNTLLSPIQKGITGAGNFFGKFEKRLNDYDELYVKYEVLRHELNEKNAKIIAADNAISENKQLKKALSMKEENKTYEFVSASVISFSDLEYEKTFTIDKGSTSGIAVDNCVLTDEGMVGYISEVGLNWATVATIIDTSMEASAMISRTREVGAIEGNYSLIQNGRLKLLYLKKDTSAVAGDTVITSGIGSVFPPNLIIGTIEEIQLEAHGISKFAVIKPAVDIDSLQDVLIIKSFQNK